MGSVIDYIASLGDPARSTIEHLFERAMESAPGAEEGTSYGMAALHYRGKPLVSILATKQGYSVYPFSTVVVADLIAGFEGLDSTKGSIRSSDRCPVPDTAFDRLVRARRDEIDAALVNR